MAYCTRADIEALFSPTDVLRWADVENEGDAGDITARIDTACSRATSEVDDMLRGGPYAVPFGEPVPDRIIDITAKLAAVWLYVARGSQDVETDDAYAGRLSEHRRDAHNTIRMIHAGTMRLGLPSRCRAYPSVVPITDPADDERSSGSDLLV